MAEPMKNQYKYDAFISYRHKELDKFVAENLHKQMESFKLPGNVSRKHKGGRTKIERVFRDKEELPISSSLEDPIIDALKNSEYLVVICTPRIRESIWCKKEISTFIQMHGRDKVLAVLAEGEPDESFPEELLYKEVTVNNPDGTTSVVREPVEPLAADVRGKNNKEVLKAIKAELPRLLAPMFDMTYDDLKQRHRERRMKKILAASLTVAGVCLAFGAVSTVMALQINSQKNQIEEKNMEIVARNAQISSQAEEIRKQNEELSYNQALNLAAEAERKLADGDRIGAIQTAIYALTEYEGIQMPYTEEAQYALTNSLYAYRKSSSIIPDFQLETVGVVEAFCVSPEENRAFVVDSANVASIYDVNDGTLIKRLDHVYVKKVGAYAFLDNDRVAYVTDGFSVCIYDIKTDSVTECWVGEWLNQVFASNDGRYLAGSDSDHGYVMDMITGETIFSFVPDKERVTGQFAFYTEGEEPLFLYGTREEDFSNYTIHICNLMSGTNQAIALGNYAINSIVCDKDSAYIQMSYYNDNKDGYRTQVRSYNLSTRKLNWKYEAEDSLGSALAIGEGDIPCIFVGLSWEGVLLNSETGKEMAHFSFGSSIVEAYPLNNVNLFGVFTQDGVFHSINAEMLEDVIIMDFFICHTNSIRYAGAINGGFLIGSYPENRVVRYSLFDPDVEPEEELTESPNTETMPLKEREEYAIEHGYEVPELIGEIFFNEDNSLTFVYYRDCTLRIYDAKDQLLNTIKGSDSGIRIYYGKDKNGNYYVGNYVMAYMISPNHKVMGKIYYPEAIDAESNSIIISDKYGEKQYRYPIYSLDELIDMGKETVLKYTHTN